MSKKTTRWLLLLFFSCFTFSACGNNCITQEEYDKIVSEKNDYKEKYEIAVSERDLYKEQYESTKKELEELTTIASLEQSDAGVQSSVKYTEEELAKLVDIVEYPWANGTNVVLVTNNSDVVLYVGANISTKDSNGRVINNFAQKTPSIEPEKTNWFMYTCNNDEIATIDMDLDIIEVPNYTSILPYIDYNITDQEDGIAIECTNISEHTLYNVNCSILFLKDDNVVSIGLVDFSDYDFELKSGTSITKTCTLPQNSSYEKYIYVFSGNIR